MGLKQIYEFTEESTFDSTYNYLIQSTVADSTYYRIAGDTLKSGIKNASVYSIVADYIITDTDGYDTICVNPTTGDVLITLPTLADNIGRKITVKVTHAGGRVTVDGEVAETIDGDASVYLQGQYDYITIEAKATGWNIISLRQTWQSGWLTRNDWTAVEFGSCELAYDNLGGAGFTVGEWIEDGTSGARGIIMADSGTVLKLKNVNGLVFAENNEIVGDTSAETADVDTPLPKNADTDVHHMLGKNIRELNIKWFMSADGTENNSYEIKPVETGNSATGWIIYQTDTNSFELQSGTNGINFLNANGTNAILDVEDEFYQIEIKRLI